MIKLTYCVRRLPAVSAEEFHRYWRDVHGPLVRDRAAALGVRRYVQVHALTTPLNDALRAGRGAQEPYDGVAELWWDSVQDLQAAARTPDGRQAGLDLLEDERRFIDLGRSALWLGEEHAVVDGA